MQVRSGIGSESANSRSEQTRIEFLDSELDLAQTFLDVADLEADDPERRAMAEKNARAGYETVVAWIGVVRDWQESERLKAKLVRLENRLVGGVCPGPSGECQDAF